MNQNYNENGRRLNLQTFKGAAIVLCVLLSTTNSIFAAIGTSAVFKIDLTEGTRTAALTERIQYSTQWTDGYKPKYVAIDLSGGTSATSYPVEYFDDIPGGTWSDEYKTTKLVLRRIPAGSFMMGGRDTDYPGAVNTNLHMVTLTKDFYMGVFEVTQRQWELIMGNRPSAVSNKTYYAKRPVEKVSYQDIRGASKGLNWPNSTEVDAGTFIDALRKKSGFSGFDLPTEAQWEYACRAGTETALNTGKDLSSMSNSVEMLEAGQYWEQSGWIENGYKWSDDVFGVATTNKATAYVGTFTPNAWGLYDMHGNVWELCLDVFSDTEVGEIDPAGPNIDDERRVIRGGSWRHPSWACRSAHREYFRNYTKMFNVGLRLCLHGGDCIDIDVESMFPDAVALVEIDGEEFSAETGTGFVEWTPKTNGTYVLTHKVMNGEEQIGETLSATFLVEGLAPDAPVIAPESRTTFSNSLTVSMTCPTEGATIHYTTDGSEPTAESTTYKKFRVYGKTTVKAIAIKDGMLPSEVVSAEYALGRCANPVISLTDGSEFAHSNQEVSIDWGEDGVLRYTLDGSEPTAESPVYEGPFSFSESVVLKAKVFSDDFFDSDVAASSLTRVWESVATPQIAVAESFTGSKTKVEIGCATEGALIRYTLNGNEPNSHSTKYTGPFYVTESCTIKAYAIMDDYLNSAVAERSVEKIWTIGDSMGDPDHTFTTGGNRNIGWTSVVDDAAPNGVAMKSGEITHEEATVLGTFVEGPGTLTFTWRTSCEEDPDGLYEWDHAEFSVDGVVRLRLDGVTEWKAESVKIDGEGEHSIEWKYLKDDVEGEGEDAAWVAGYGWEPYATETKTTEVPVPYEWIRKYCPEIADETSAYEAAANAMSGKTQGGKATRLWEEFVAGTDPTNATSVFTAKIEMKDGEPVVTWEPNLNTNGVERLYKIHGKETLSPTEEWAYPTNSLHRFFKVTVEMP